MLCMPGICYLAGSLALLFGAVLWVTTLPCIRRHAFNVFLWCHIIGESIPPLLPVVIATLMEEGLPAL